MEKKECVFQTTANYKMGGSLGIHDRSLAPNGQMQVERSGGRIALDVVNQITNLCSGTRSLRMCYLFYDRQHDTRHAGGHATSQ